MDAFDSITDEFCEQQKAVFDDETSFEDRGGMAQMGAALESMVLVMSLWDDHAAGMLWLDSNYPTDKDASTPGVARGTCATTSGVPATIESSDSNAQVIFSNIKFGPIGSTFNSGSVGSSPPPTSAPGTTTTPTTIMTTALDALKQTGTVVVSDSGDFECEHLSALA